MSEDTGKPEGLAKEEELRKLLLKRGALRAPAGGDGKEDSAMDRGHPTPDEDVRRDGRESRDRQRHRSRSRSKEGRRGGDDSRSGHPGRDRRHHHHHHRPPSRQGRDDRVGGRSSGRSRERSRERGGDRHRSREPERPQRDREDGSRNPSKRDSPAPARMEPDVGEDGGNVGAAEPPVKGNGVPAWKLVVDSDEEEDGGKRAKVEEASQPLPPAADDGPTRPSTEVPVAMRQPSAFSDGESPPSESGDEKGNGKKRGRWDTDDEEEDDDDSGRGHGRKAKTRKAAEGGKDEVEVEPASGGGRAFDEEVEQSFKVLFGRNGGGFEHKEPQPIVEVHQEDEGQKDKYNPLLYGCRSVTHYERIGTIAQGTYGVVFKARNTKTDKTVALKLVKLLPNAKKEGFSINALREINVLLALRHPNIVRVHEMVIGSAADKVYMVMEYFDNDLKHVLDTVPDLLGEGDKKWLMYQLLKGVECMHSHWYLHRDLKTSNILVTKKGRLAIGDFGLARKYGDPLQPYTPVVVTPGYRCPELLLGVKTYSTAVDMWSVGCIFGELLVNRPLFRADTDALQLETIFKIMGTPTESNWPGYSKLPNASVFKFKQHRGNLREHIWKTYEGKTYSSACYDLLEGLLEMNPARRLTASQALRHAFFRESPVMTLPENFPLLPIRRSYD